MLAPAKPKYWITLGGKGCECPVSHLHVPCWLGAQLPSEASTDSLHGLHPVRCCVRTVLISLGFHEGAATSLLRLYAAAPGLARVSNVALAEPDIILTRAWSLDNTSESLSSRINTFLQMLKHLSGEQMISRHAVLRRQSTVSPGSFPFVGIGFPILGRTCDLQGSL